MLAIEPSQADLKTRVVNVADLMKLQSQTEDPHGLSHMDFDELFTKDKPVIFAIHAYPWLIHRLTHRCTNHRQSRNPIRIMNPYEAARNVPTQGRWTWNR